ncbi:MAG: DUF819 family protein [Pirellulales bacterium]|nr:DUF819 family protein [Pirellulales bacterium]
MIFRTVVFVTLPLSILLLPEVAFAAAPTESLSNRPAPLVTNDAVVLGLLMAILGFVFWTNSLRDTFWEKFYKFCPMLLLCYFLPSLLTLSNVVDPAQSKLYFVASRYMLPASLVLLTLSIDLKEVLRLGPKAIVMFLTGTVGVVVGGPLAILVVGAFSPELVGGADAEAVWRGLSTVAGSWIGGGANQAAMKEIFQPSESLYSVMVAVDVIVAEVWMTFLLLGIGKADWIDKKFGADSSSVARLREKMEHFSLGLARIPSAADLFAVLAVGFGVTAVSHWFADLLAPAISANYPELQKFSLDSTFFWLIVLATTGGVILSFTKLRQLEGVGASKLGTVCIFFLVATIGLQMDVRAVFQHPGLFLVGGVWMVFHVGLLFIVGKLIRAPYFFLAVGSKANIGGAASAPVVAAAFHPSLAPVGVLLAVVGYALGTYGAYLCAIMMRSIAPG